MSSCKVIPSKSSQGELTGVTHDEKMENGRLASSVAVVAAVYVSSTTCVLGYKYSCFFMNDGGVSRGP